MGRGHDFYYSLGLLTLHLLLLLAMLRTIGGLPYVILAFAFLFFAIYGAIIVITSDNIKYPLMSLYFGLGLFCLVFIYFSSRTYLLLAFALVEVVGYIYSLEKIKKINNNTQKKLSDFTNISPVIKKNTGAYILDKNMPIPSAQTPPAQKEEGVNKLPPVVEVYHHDEGKQHEPALFVGSKTSGKFHLPGCRYVKNISKKNKLTFSSLKDAKDKGFKKCVCVKR